MPTLIATSGPLVDQRFEIAADLVLGREGADLIVPDDELSAGYIVPSVFNKHVAELVAVAVAEQARIDGVCRSLQG